MANWIEIGALNDIPKLGARIVSAQPNNIAVFRGSDDSVYAVDNKCPHKGGPLSEGIVHGCRVTCPLHNWVLDLETGKAQGPDEGEVRTWPVKVMDGNVYLQYDTAETEMPNAKAVNE